jgi:RHS repeat-associated protein
LYSYDRSNRLTNAQFSGVGNENYSVSNSYDANGNILTLQRYSKTGANTFGLVDNLTYSYLSNGNKLQKVDDAVSGNIGANDFRDISGNDYAFSVDGKLTKDGNKSITNIDYNYLDLVSKVTFADGTKVETFYTSTGERRQRRVTKNGITSYTLYDGEIVYTFTGVNTSLNDFKVSEIQNPEGRFVGGKLEYGYTDHIGNLRLSYKDSLGVAFITQSQSYDPWSNINAGSEYQLSGIQGDRYLVSGKENDSVTGNTLLDWRDYDSVTGRMNSFDPDGSEGGQISLSPFAYSWNNPVSLNDPDGRCPMCIGFMIGIFTSAIGNMASGKMPSNIGQFLLPGVQGAIGGGIASAIGGAFAGMGSFAGKGLLQAGTHALSGGLQSAAWGGNFWQGAASSGISSGFASGADALGLCGVGQLLGGGLSGGLSSELFGGSFWDGARDGLIVSGLNHLSHFIDKPKKRLDPSTIKKNIGHLTYPGPDNPMTYPDPITGQRDYDYSYAPESPAEYPAIGHDRRYDKLKVQGASGLFGDTRAIGADYKFVSEQLSLGNLRMLHPNYKTQSLVLGLGLGLFALPKTIYQFTRPMNGANLFETMLWYNVSSQGITNKPSR